VAEIKLTLYDLHQIDLAEEQSTINVPLRLTVKADEDGIRLTVKPSRMGFTFGLIMNCGLVLMPIAFGWKHLVRQ
jgi:hypothetical protein